MLYSTLWAYRTSVKTTTGFSPFQLVYGLKVVLPIECQIPSLKLVVHLLPYTYPLEELLVHLEKLNEQRRDAALANEAHKHKVKCQYDRFVRPQIFSNGDLVLVYDQDNQNFQLSVYSDADWANCMDERKSMSGGAFFLGDSLVAWLSKKKGSISLSTTEAEYIAATTCCT
jgi:hypothetical protein